MKPWHLLLLCFLITCDSGQGTPDPNDGDTHQDADIDTSDDADDSDDSDVDEDAESDTDDDIVPDSDTETEPNECDPGSIVAAISEDEIRATIAELTSFAERSTHSSQTEVANMLRDQLSDYGLEVNDHEYSYNGRFYDNLEIVIPGDDLADVIYAAGAHFDSTSNVPGNAPGADDNASGTAGIVEIARVMADCQYRRTIRLLLFSNEEVGMIGSAEYAQNRILESDDFQGFLNLDMIAYGPPDEDLDVATKPKHSSLLESVVGATERWTDLDVVTHIDDHCG